MLINVYHLLAKVKETSTKLGMKQKKPEYLTPHNSNSTVTQMVPKKQKVPQRHNNGTTRAINVKKTKKVTLKRSHKVYTATDKDFSTWEYYHQLSHPHFNLPTTHYPRVKLTDENVFVHDPPNLAIIFHSATPRYDLFFQKVDNKITTSTEYVYVSMYIYSLKKNA